MTAACPCEYMLSVDEAAAHFLDRFVEFKTDHQSSSPDFFNLRNLFQFFLQVLSYCGCIVDQIFFFDDIHYGQCCGASQMIASECRA